MKKSVLVWLCILFTIISPGFSDEKTPTAQQAALLEAFGDDVTGMSALSEDELIVFIDYGNELQAETANEILNNRRKRAMLEGMINNLIQKKKNLDTRECYYQPLRQDYENQIARLYSDLNELNDTEQANLEQRTALLQQQKDSDNSKKLGDPVKITRGSYEQLETDFSIGTTLPLTINRNYDSESIVYSSFGYGWSTNLDERIILGTEPDAQNTYTKTSKILTDLIRIINTFKNKLLTEYEITGIEEGKEQLTQSFDSIISECQSISSQASSDGYSDISATAQAITREIQQIKSVYLSHFSIDKSFLNKLNAFYNETQKENQEAKKRMEASAKRRAQNAKALFPGMADNYDGTGLNTIILIDEDSYPHILYETESDTWQNNNDRKIIEAFKTSTGYTVLLSNGTEKLYDSNGFIIKITDRNQNYITITRNKDETIKSIQSSYGEKLLFTYNSSYISKITNARCTEQTAEYSYKDGKLISVTDSDGDTVGMEYNSNGQMTTLKKCDGSKVQFIYGQITNDKRILTTQTIDEENNSEYFIYDINQKRTIYKDHDQNQAITFYDDRQRTIREISSDGSEITYKYDENDNLIETAADGKTTFFSYDSKGNKIRAVYDDGTFEEFNYDSYNLITYCKDHDGIIQQFIRDSRGNLTEYITGGSTALSLNYDEKGNIIRSTIYKSSPVITEYEYDSFGNCILQKNAGICYGFEYDSLNRITKILLDNKALSCFIYEPKKITRTDYNGLETTYITNGRKDITDIIEKDTFTGIIHKTRIEYDKRHLPVKIFAGDGKEEYLIREYLYSPEGKLISQTFVGQESFIKKQEALNNNSTTSNMLYSGAGRLIKEQTEWGGFYEFEYNSEGYLKSFGQENKTGTSYTYYPDGSLKTSTDPFGITTSCSYDQTGNLISKQNSRGTTLYEYDKLGRIINAAVTEPYNTTTQIFSVSYEYSQNNRTITMLKGGKYKTVNELDAFGNVIKQTDGNGNTREYKYDCQNQLVEAYDGYKNKTVYEYNALGLIKSVTLPEGTKTDYEYDESGQLIKITDGCGTVYKAEYDKDGRIIKEKTRSTAAKTYEYDENDRITKILCEGQIIEAYAYEQQGTKLTVTDANGADYLYNLNSFGQLVSEKNRLGLTQSFCCDEEGNLKSQKSFDGSTTDIFWSDNRTVCTSRYHDGSETRFVYDAIGNIIQAQNAYSNTQYEYDKGGQLIRQKDITTGEEIRFEYDAAGNRIKLTGANKETRYIYGANNELKEFFDNKQRVSVQLQYNKNGWEILRKFGNGTTVHTRYDQAGRTTLKYQKNSFGEILWGEGYVYGQDGKRTATVDTNARVTLYEYDRQGRLSAVYYPYTQEHEELLKKEAETNGLPVNGSAAMNKYLSADEKSMLASRLNEIQYTLAYSLTTMQLFIKEAYSYDKNGNRTAKTSPLGKTEYSYDKENRLISSGSRGQPFVTYTYDNLGNLLSEDSATKSIKYAYNSENRLVYSEVNDRANNEYAQTTYAYDAFGRRILTKDFDGPELRTLYDGFTFDVIKQGPVFANSTFTSAYESEINWNRTTQPTGERYRYLSDDYNSSSDRYSGERSQFTANGTIAVQVSDEGIQYYTTDLLNSIRSETDINGRKAVAYSYDAFGTLVQGSFTGLSDTGYLGKQQDPSTRLYNYGYRDYNPSTARFTTTDPIRDGTNWFVYCNSDPVNFVDLWGDAVKDQGFFTQQMSTSRIGESTSTIDKAGCVLTAYVRIAQTIAKKTISLDEANRYATKNNLYENGDELSVENGVKLINALIKETGKKVVYSGSLEGTTTEIAKQINELEASDLDYFLTARINTTNEDATQKYEHTVSINSNSVFANDITDIENSLNIRINDTSSANRKSVENDERENEIIRVDYFAVKEK